MPDAPTVVALDVNETLSDLEPLRARFEDMGAPGRLLDTWFAATLRDGFALTAAGAYVDFGVVARASLLTLFAEVASLRRDPDEAADHILAGFADLDVHSDVAAGMRLLADAGVRLVTLSNGASEVAARLLERAGLADLVERRLSVADVKRWKPAPEPYLYAANACGVPARQVALVAVHPWDIDGAKRAGLRAGWLNRRQRPYPPFLRPPDVTGETLAVLAEGLLSLD